MTTEDDFQNKIDENVEDWDTRLVFADWLQDRDDPRAEGYRAIARRKRYPLRGTSLFGQPWWWYRGNADFRNHNHIPDDWFDLLPRELGTGPLWPTLSRPENVRNRRECEDALALAFAQLPEARRLELLRV